MAKSTQDTKSRLKRKRQSMPPEVREALDTEGLMQRYLQRPAYQQNDYLAWISRAKRPQTKANRLRQMLDELESGGVYMKMKHGASAQS